MKTPAPKHMHLMPDDRQQAEFETNIGMVARQLQAMGHDPVKKLVEACRGDKLSEWQKAAIDKELLKYVAPQLKAVEHTGYEGGPLQVELVRFADTTAK